MMYVMAAVAHCVGTSHDVGRSRPKPTSMAQALILEGLSREKPSLAGGFQAKPSRQITNLDIPKHIERSSQSTQMAFDYIRHMLCWIYLSATTLEHN